MQIELGVFFAWAMKPSDIFLGHPVQWILVPTQKGMEKHKITHLSTTTTTTTVTKLGQLHARFTADFIHDCHRSMLTAGVWSRRANSTVQNISSACSRNTASVLYKSKTNLTKVVCKNNVRDDVKWQFRRSGRCCRQLGDSTNWQKVVLRSLEMTATRPWRSGRSVRSFPPRRWPRRERTPAGHWARVPAPSRPADGETARCARRQVDWRDGGVHARRALASSWWSQDRRSTTLCSLRRWRPTHLSTAPRS